MGSSRCTSCLLIFALAILFAFVTIGIIGIVLGPGILQNQISNQLPLTVYSDQVASWEVPPVPIYFQVWLWECVNVYDAVRGTKPMIVQRGPFTYLEHRRKEGVAFNENYTVSYRQKILYTYVPEMSVDEELEITMVNTPLVTIVSLVRAQSNFTQEIFNFVAELFNESLFIKHTAREWIWGYEDLLLKEARKIPILQDLIPDDHFGYFYGQNGTDDGLYTVFTGGNNIELLNNINKWNGVSYLTFWDTPWANQINGTDGSWFPPLYNKDLSSTRLYLFSTDVCRSLYAKFEDHSSVLDIPTEIFSIPAELFVNSSVNPDNAAFDLNISGIFNVSKCRQGAPVFISFPHLLYADDDYTSRVDGLAPDANIHRTLFEIEQHTGLVLNAQKRLQINVLIQPDRLIDDFRLVKEVILPAIWINESTTIDQKSADELNNKIFRLFVIVRWVSILLIPFGVILFIIMIIIFTKRRSQSYSARLIVEESHNAIAYHD